MKQVFLIASTPLSDVQYDRLKKQLNKDWKKNHPNTPRPLLLENGLRVQVEEVS